MNTKLNELGNILLSVAQSISNRDWAVILWISLFVCYQMKRETFRSCMTQILSLLLTKKIALSILLCYSYMFTFVYFAHKTGFAHLYNAKDIVFWCILVPIPSMMSYIMGNKTDFIRFALGNGTLVSFILALQSYFTFNFLIEFISFPLLCLAAALSAYAQTDKIKYGTIYKFINTSTFFIGLLILLYSLYQAINDVNELVENHFIPSFLFNESLYIIYTPLLYLYCVIAAYEEWFIMLKSRSSTDNYKNRCIFFIKKCGLNLFKIRYISKHLHVYVPQTEEQLIVDFLECDKKYLCKNEQ